MLICTENFLNISHDFENNISQVTISGKTTKSRGDSIPILRSSIMHVYEINLYSLGGVGELVLLVLLVDKVEPTIKHLNYKHVS